MVINTDPQSHDFQPKKNTHINSERQIRMGHGLLVVIIAVVIITATVASGPIGLMGGTLFFLFYLLFHTIAAWVIVIVAVGIAL